MKTTFKKPVCVISVDNIHQIVCKRQRIRPFLNYWMKPMQHATSALKMVQEQSNNWTTIHCKTLCMHDYLVTAFDWPVRTGDVTTNVPSRTLARPVSCRPVENGDVWTRPKGITRFNCTSLPTVWISVVCVSENKQRLCPCMALTDRFP